MALINAGYSSFKERGQQPVDKKDVRVTYLLVGDDDTGEWVEIGTMADKTIHVFGTWDSATLVVQGSNEEGTPTNPQTLTDPQGNALSKTADFIEAILENPIKMRISTSGGLGSTVLTVIISAKGETR